jgi:hypothetical protein
MGRWLVLLIVTMVLPSVRPAAEVRLIQFDADNQVVTVLEDDRESSYKLASSVKVYLVLDAKGRVKEATPGVAAKILSHEQFKGKSFEITVHHGAITELKFPARRNP